MESMWIWMRDSGREKEKRSSSASERKEVIEGEAMEWAIND